MKPEILYYNNFIVPSLIRDRVKDIVPYLSSEYTHKLFDLYEKFGLNKFNVVYDRTGNIPHYLNMAPDMCPIPARVHNYNNSFFDVTELRCKEILSHNKPVYVLWSGGIDSTYILFMLRHFANDKDQVRVLGTFNSIIESGDMFDRKIKNSMIYDIGISSSNYVKYNEDALYVSGQCGNQLFGPTDDMFAQGQTAMFHHTLGTPETIYESYEKHVNPELTDFLKPAINASPRKIETVADLRWFCIFNLDWYTSVYCDKILLPKQKSDRIHSFFNTVEFQEWAVNTSESFTKVKGDSTTHRWQMRDVLSDLFGEREYARNKTKKISNFGISDSSWLFFLKNNETIILQN
jgi:hypothetical protein